MLHIERATTMAAVPVALLFIHDVATDGACHSITNITKHTVVYS